MSGGNTLSADGRGATTGSGAANFGRFFTLSPDLLCVIGLDGYFKELNPAWEKALGFSPAELKAKPSIEFVHPDDREGTRLEMRGLIAGAGQTAFANRTLCADGSYKWLTWTASLVMEEGVIYAIARDVTARRQREDSLHQALAQQRELLARLLSVREEERTHLARVVHDELGQLLTGLKMDLAWLQGHLDLDQASLLAKTQVMSNLIDTTIQAVRQISIELRPAILDDLGLVAAIEWQLQDLQKRTGLQCELSTSPEEVTLDIDGRTTVFRIFQEILTNVSRHAHATQVQVSLEETGEHLILQVQDNGRGISRDEIRSAKSIGLLGMRERARLRGGEVHVQGTAGQGTTVTVRLPLDRGQPVGHDKGTGLEGIP
jgi:PAS domain S-box-containing protein